MAATDIELLFITEILDDHGKYLFDILTENIKERNMVKSGLLLDSLKYTVVINNDGNATLKFRFNTYGRILEIQYYRSKNTKLTTEKLLNKTLWGIKSKNDMGRRKNYKWYTRAIYGSKYHLMDRLLTEFTAEEIYRLKKILTDQQSRGFDFRKSKSQVFYD